MNKQHDLNENEEYPRLSREQLDQAQKELTRLGSMKHEVPLLLFTDPTINSQYSEVTRAVIRAVRQLTDKITCGNTD